MVAGWKSSTQAFLEERDLRLKTVAEFANFNALLYALKYSDVITIMPKKLVEVLGSDAEVKPLELPYDIPEFEVGLIWNRSLDNDPEHLWFREMVAKSLEGI